MASPQVTGYGYGIGMWIGRQIGRSIGVCGCIRNILYIFDTVYYIYKVKKKF